MADTFNADAARRAITSARQEIEELVKNFEQTRSNVSENFGQEVGEAAAMGGLVGNQAQRTFEEDSSPVFQQLSSNMSNFIDNRVETIIRNSISMEDAARSTYASK